MSDKIEVIVDANKIKEDNGKVNSNNKSKAIEGKIISNAKTLNNKTKVNKTKVNKKKDEERIKIIECPRDAIQGIPEIIPTKLKKKYINELLQLGFDVIDFGSFVSPKAIPQMADTAKVLAGLDLSKTKTKLLSIVPNVKGGKIAAKYEKISCIGYPFSISKEFLKRNTKTTIAKSLVTVGELLKICEESEKKLVIYISMAFGNPYDEEWSLDLLEDWVKILNFIGVEKIILSDTTSNGTSKDIQEIFSQLIPKYEHIEFGLHAHTTEEKWYKVVDAAYNGGCRRYDVVIGGKGGCPLSGYEMLGNLKTKNLLKYLGDKHKIKDFSDLESIY